MGALLSISKFVHKIFVNIIKYVTVVQKPVHEMRRLYSEVYMCTPLLACCNRAILSWGGPYSCPFFFNLLLLLSPRVLPPRYATGYLQCVYLLQYITCVLSQLLLFSELICCI
jgi:hypothetical protein